MDATIQQLEQSIIARLADYEAAVDAVSQLYAVGQAITPQLKLLRAQTCAERDSIRQEVDGLEMQQRRVCIERMYEHYDAGKTLEEATDLLRANFGGEASPTEPMHQEFLFASMRTARQLRATHGDHEDVSIQTVLEKIEKLVHGMVEYGIYADGMHHHWEGDMVGVLAKLEAKRQMLNLMLDETPEERAARLADAEEAEAVVAQAGMEVVEW